jgi:hypothetical protein
MKMRKHCENKQFLFSSYSKVLNFARQMKKTFYLLTQFAGRSYVTSQPQMGRGMSMIFLQV